LTLAASGGTGSEVLETAAGGGAEGWDVGAVIRNNEAPTISVARVEPARVLRFIPSPGSAAVAKGAHAGESLRDNVALTWQPVSV
jgi:hypothetical protein